MPKYWKGIGCKPNKGMSDELKLAIAIGLYVGTMILLFTI